MACQEKAEEEDDAEEGANEEEDANKEEDEEGMTLCKSLCWLLTYLMRCFFYFYLLHMMTTEEEGEDLAGDRMSLFAAG